MRTSAFFKVFSNLSMRPSVHIQVYKSLQQPNEQGPHCDPFFLICSFSILVHKLISYILVVPQVNLATTLCYHNYMFHSSQTYLCNNSATEEVYNAWVNKNWTFSTKKGDTHTHTHKKVLSHSILLNIIYFK